MCFALYPYWLSNFSKIKPIKKANIMRKFDTAEILFSLLTIPFISYAKAVSKQLPPKAVALLTPQQRWRISAVSSRPAPPPEAVVSLKVTAKGTSPYFL